MISTTTYTQLRGENFTTIRRRGRPNNRDLTAVVANMCIRKLILRRDPQGRFSLTPDPEEHPSWKRKRVKFRGTRLSAATVGRLVDAGWCKVRWRDEQGRPVVVTGVGVGMGPVAPARRA